MFLLHGDDNRYGFYRDNQYDVYSAHLHSGNLPTEELSHFTLMFHDLLSITSLISTALICILPFYLQPN